MRYIKFRGKDKRTGEWVYGYYVMNNLLLPEKGESITKHFIIDGIGQKNEILADTVGQYIGIEDKNGKEIYEGDIVKFYIGGVGFAKGVVILHNFCWAIKRGDAILNFDYFGSNLKNIEVIGNIHDNPELIKGGEKP